MKGLVLLGVVFAIFIGNQQCQARTTDSLNDVCLINENYLGKAFSKILKDSVLASFEVKIEKEKLIEDFDQLVESLKGHPDQFEFIEKQVFDGIVRNQRAKIIDSLTVTEFYQIVIPIVTSIGCLHTRLVDNRFFRTNYSYWLPLIVRFENQKMYAINNRVNTDEMNVGSEIIEINGVSSTDIYQKLQSSISADAFNSNFYKDDLNLNFLYYYHSFFGFNSGYKIKFKPYKSEEELTTEFFIKDTILAYKVDLNNTPRLSLNIVKEEETAIIRIKNFSFFPRGNQNIDFFRKEIDSYMSKIIEGNIKKVVFDLHGNRGGNPACTAHILSYISDRDIPFYEANDVNESRNRPATIKPHINNISDKKIYIISNGRSASATGQMLAVVKHNKLATIVGSESGSTYSTHPGRGMPSLNNTELGLLLGVERESVQVPKLPLERGIVPDKIIDLSIEDVIKGNNPILDFIFGE